MTASRNRLAAALAAAIVAAVPGAALAQGAAAPAEPPKPKCEAPGDYPSKLSSDMQRQRWLKSRDQYLDCMKKFIAEHQAAADPHIKAANAAIAEFNAAIKRFNEQMESPN